MNKLKTLNELFTKEGLFTIIGTTSCLGYTTDRCKFTKSDENKCLEWLRKSPKNGLKFIFEDETIEMFNDHSIC